MNPLALVSKTRRRSCALAALGLGLFGAAIAADQSGDPYAAAARYKLGDSNAPLLAIEAEVRSANPEQSRAIEARLVAILQASGTSRDATAWICRTLRLAGSGQSVPALAALLTDPHSAADAQFALRSIDSPQVDVALRAALAKTDGLRLAGVIQTLGARRDREAVASLAPLASSTDPVVVDATLYALGQIGGEAALEAARTAQVPLTLERARQHAVLLGAESLLTAGHSPQATAAFRELWESSTDIVIQSGALRGLVRAAPSAAGATLLAALRADDARLRAAAAKALTESGSDDLLQTALLSFATWPADAQVLVLGMITRPAASPACVAAAASPDDQVRRAAVEALGRVGATAQLPLLLEVAAQPGPAQDVARASLRLVPDPKANAALLDAARAGPSPRRVEALRALAARNATMAVPALLELAAAVEAPVRTAALRALGQLGRASDVPALVGLLAQDQTPGDREVAEQALSSAAQRAADRAAAAAPVRAALPQATSPVQCALLRVLAQLPGPESLAALRTALTSADPSVKDAAVRGLAEWPDPAALSELGTIVAGNGTLAQRALALRGFVRLAGLPSHRPASDTVRLLSDAMKWAQSPEEKRLVLTTLSAGTDASALEVAAGCLADPALEVEAATAIVRLARKLQATNPEAASAAVHRVLDTCKSPAARQLAESAGIVLGDLVNIAPQGVASSPDDLDKDGEASGDQAAIDGDLATYWDEADGAKLYRLAVRFAQPEKIAAVSIAGYAHQNYAPKDFDVWCDGQVVKQLANASYVDNLLVVSLPETTCRDVELRITGYYGASPAIRELGIYRRGARASAEYRVLVYSKTLGFRHANIPLGVAAIRQLGAAHGFAVDATEESAAFTPANLARYQAVVFLSVTGDVFDEAQQAAFKAYLLEGGGFVAIHGALFGPGACEETWDWYGDVCCVAFKNHSAVVPARMEVEDRANPSTTHLPAQWPRTDEWYNYNGNPRGCARVLVSIDESTYQGGTMGADHPMTWCRQMGKGRVWYTAMGHTDESFREPLFLNHILGGIQQAAGVKPADFTPQPKPALK